MFKIISLLLSVALGSLFTGQGSLTTTVNQNYTYDGYESNTSSETESDYAVVSSEQSTSADLQTDSDSDLYGSQPNDTEKLEDVECPDNWDESDPGWYRAYLQEYGTEDNTDSGVITTDDTNGSDNNYVEYLSTTSTTWKSISGSTMRFYHSSKNTENNAIIPVIDVSKWNGTINFKKVKAAGIKGVIIRCGYRTSGSGSLYVDSKFKENIKGAKNAGLKVGVYMFSQAVNKSEAKAEATYAHKLIKSTGYSLDLPLAIDVEYVNGSGRLYTAHLSKSDQTKIAAAFCEKAKSYGYTPMVYASSTFLVSKMNGAKLDAKGYQIWMARYSSSAYSSSSSYYQKSVDIWQCTSSAKVSGISNAVDLDYWYAPTSSSQSTISKVSGLKLTKRTANTLSFSWNKKSGVSGYKIYIYNGRGKTYSKKYTVSSSTTSKTVKGLAKGHEYYIRIRAYKGSSLGSWSSWLSAITSCKTRYVKTKANLNMRTYGGTQFKVKAVIPKKKKVKCYAVVYDKYGKKWYKVKYNGKTGFISSKYSYFV